MHLDRCDLGIEHDRGDVRLSLNSETQGREPISISDPDTALLCHVLFCLELTHIKRRNLPFCGLVVIVFTLPSSFRIITSAIACVLVLSQVLIEEQRRTHALMSPLALILWLYCHFIVYALSSSIIVLLFLISQILHALFPPLSILHAVS